MLKKYKFKRDLVEYDVILDNNSFIMDKADLKFLIYSLVYMYRGLTTFALKEIKENAKYVYSLPNLDFKIVLDNINNQVYINYQNIDYLFSYLILKEGDLTLELNKITFFKENKKITEVLLAHEVLFIIDFNKGQKIESLKVPMNVKECLAPNYFMDIDEFSDLNLLNEFYKIKIKPLQTKREYYEKEVVLEIEEKYRYISQKEEVSLKGGKCQKYKALLKSLSSDMTLEFLKTKYQKAQVLISNLTSEDWNFNKNIIRLRKKANYWCNDKIINFK